ncbi:MAG: DUF4179 domain-containing protein [Clostridia bacterium]|nr:DUF4179 domain-containing protein [Clostridia bacterium]
MNLHEEQEKVQKAMNMALSGLQEDPWLTQRVLANAKGEEPVKKKLSLALVLCIASGLALLGTAYALFSSQVAAFFGQHWNKDLGEWLQGGKVAQIGETVVLDGVEFTLDEVIYRDRGIYGVGTTRVQDEKNVLLPMDLVDGWDLEEASQGEEAQALIKMAQTSGGKMLSVDCYPTKIGVDEGSMISTGDTGVYNLRNEDGSITFSFETGGYALEDGTTYQVEFTIDVDEWTADGRIADDKMNPQAWTVSFEPVMMKAATEEKKTEGVSVDTIQKDGYEILLPAEYQENGTLPVYQAIEYDFRKEINPEWLNQSGIAEQHSDIWITFNDHAELQLAAEGAWYMEYTEELFDYNSRERESENPDLEPVLWPKQSISFGIASIAASVYGGNSDIFPSDITLEQDQLTLITLEEAKETAEELFDQLGLKGFELAWALDMNLNRIRTLGEAYNRLMFEGTGYSNAPRHDYDTATAEEEGYYLVYTPLGVTHPSLGNQELHLFVSSRGITSASLRCQYNQGDLVNTPDHLISIEEAVTTLYQEVANTRNCLPVGSIERVALTYMLVRAENKADGMAFVPSWQIRYREEGREYTAWAEVNALNGKLIDASFR